ncbi:MAG: peptide methionine sulfoxide reductase [Campylobacterota bacterium]|nr:peptide methionine sulfoxide reductase [Campylobacterota bacterium]
MNLKEEFNNKLLALKDGSYDVFYKDKRYLLSKQTLLDSKLIKLYAKELGANDFISLNYYPNINDGLIKPCEMPQEKVIDFIVNIKVIY